MDTGHAGQKKNCAWIRTRTPIFNKSVPNQDKRTKMVNQQMSQCGAFIIGAVCICSKKLRAVESNPRNILSKVTCILYNSVLWWIRWNPSINIEDIWWKSKKRLVRNTFDSYVFLDKHTQSIAKLSVSLVFPFYQTFRLFCKANSNNAPMWKRT